MPVLLPGTLSLPTAPGRDLAAAARAVSQAVVLIGNPVSGIGTAFVISKRDRLLATAAHVADTWTTAGSLTVLCNGTATPCNVQQVWYHPGVVRGTGRLLIRCRDPLLARWPGPCPDLAVVQLAEGPELTAEVTLATPEELQRTLPNLWACWDFRSTTTGNGRPPGKVRSRGIRTAASAG